MDNFVVMLRIHGERKFFCIIFIKLKLKLLPIRKLNYHNNKFH